MESHPSVSIIIPCRNEASFIAACLDSLISVDYPKEKLEIIVIDGASEDGTRKILDRYAKDYPFVRVINNAKKIIPTAINIGIDNAKGSILLRVGGAHAVFPKNYVSICVKSLEKCGADVIGGRIITISRGNTLLGKAIISAITSFWGAGNAYWRHGIKTQKPFESDAVFGFCCRKELFDEVERFDENIARSEDVCFYSELKRMGKKVFMVPELSCDYYARSDFKSFVKHNFDNGFWITYPLKFKKVLFSWRHLIPLFFVTGIIGFFVILSIFSLLRVPDFYSHFLWLVFLSIMGLYLAINLIFSLEVAFRLKDARLFLLMPFIYATLHIVYGLGSIRGLIKLIH